MIYFVKMIKIFRDMKQKIRLSWFIFYYIILEAIMQLLHMIKQRKIIGKLKNFPHNLDRFQTQSQAQLCPKITRP